MSYQVLARKYRPQKFSEVIGQEHVTHTLTNAIEQGRIAHGYIFSGHRGIGKTTVARILAMALNCRSADHPVAEPCGVCDSCTEIRAGNAVDVIEIDAATNRGIDEIRELREAARYRPSMKPTRSPTRLSMRCSRFWKSRPATSYLCLPRPSPKTSRKPSAPAASISVSGQCVSSR